MGAIAARPSERIAARPGLFVAIVGPSGAGKDSAILASSARLAARCREGSEGRRVDSPLPRVDALALCGEYGPERVFAVLRRFPLGAGEAA